MAGTSLFDELIGHKFVAKQERKMRKWKLQTSAEIIKRLEQLYEIEINKSPTKKELSLFQAFIKRNDIRGGEYWFCPEENYYEPILAKLTRKDVVFDAGAGDLRFDLLMARKVKRVYAIEINPTIVEKALHIMGLSKPKNLFIIVGNAFQMPIPADVTIITCLMIHRAHNPRHWEGYRIIQT